MPADAAVFGVQGRMRHELVLDAPRSDGLAQQLGEGGPADASLGGRHCRLRALDDQPADQGSLVVIVS